MCRIVLAKYKMYSVGGGRDFFYCEDLFVQNFFLMDVILNLLPLISVISS